MNSSQNNQNSEYIAQSNIEEFFGDNTKKISKWGKVNSRRSKLKRSLYSEIE